MTLPVLSDEDIDALAALTADLDFTDAERRAVLLEGGTRDVNAAPGSGKTTVLAAKLLLLARKWPDDRRGICVLSHTNVAREEIQKRLAGTPDGSRLLAYPHFIGTIHAFVNQFLALPFLRSEGLEVDVIDDEVFANRAIGMAMRKAPLRGWAANNDGVKPMVGGLVFRGSGLELVSEGGKLPKPDSKSYPLLHDIKLELTAKGVFRYADMFAFAEALLKKSPALRGRLSKRFPLVFIDEMQDTSWAQEDLLNRLFDDTVTVQRLGDLNQRILGSDEGAANLTFPRAPALTISTSKRFGPLIAAAVSGVRVGGAAVVGTSADVHPPMLLTYATARVGEVLNLFGQKVLERFSDEQLGSGSVRALCARKQGDAKEEPGRSLIDYWPGYGGDVKSSGSRSERFWALLASPRLTASAASTLVDRAVDAKRAVLLVLRAAGSEHVSTVRDGPQLLRRLQEAGQDTAHVRLLCRTLALQGTLGASKASRLEVPGLFYQALKGLLPSALSFADFAKLSVFEEPEDAPEVELEQRHCRVEHGGRQVQVEIGSIASMKGETHLATLVLESFGWRPRRFDLELALPVLAGVEARDARMTDHQLALFRNLYVGMSRPTSFLCISANESRVREDVKRGLAAQGWVVERLG
ncbi:UvrD-helicase domain-containing protein [Inhella proteolytica]|uniref:DNA 3'-5' helicase II n=1 Tax=Inhella proteolytica TaxID=2795029 RepID=A0A931ND38_9BURK|nr:UvrD-helicase domain-containing protein [Inhella proteolytica]MBH9576257.1 UvrD-helicase domain-containing protein [Inhella proteolytica]